MMKELPLHDATFDGIVITGKMAELLFTRPDGTGCRVQLDQVRELQIDDFRIGNIVVIFEITKGEAPRSTINLGRLYPAPHPSTNEEYLTKHADFIAARMSEIETGSLTLVEMQPAYGADLLALCEMVTVNDDRDVR